MVHEGPFTQDLWMAIQPVYKQILVCSFVRHLTDGTLPFKWLAHYISQDVLFIIDDSRALAATAARAEHPDEMYFLLQLAKDGLEMERALHNDFMQKLKISGAVAKSPAFKAYSDFLLDNAFNSAYPVSVAALLPCFWVYFNSGEQILANSIENNPYSTWIATYSSEEYRQYTQSFIRITENLAKRSEPGIREQMINAFTEGAKHELQVLEEASSQ
jgi:thiaminase (transcriptional activator TenA)